LLLSLKRGEEITYGAIEKRMRVVKKEASELKERLEKGEGVDAATEKPQKATKPKAKKDGKLVPMFIIVQANAIDRRP